MDYKQLFEDIESGQWSGAYLFYGEEEYIKEKALARVLDVLIPKEVRDLNYEMIDGSEIEPEIIINACETLPFMSSKRLIVVKDFYMMVDGKKGNEEEEKLILNYLENINETTCLIFYCRGDVDKRKSIYKYIRKTGKDYEFSRLNNKELNQWIVQTLGKNGKKMSQSCISYFIDRVGNNLENVYNEILKLIDYVGDNKTIDIDSVDQVVAPSLEQSIFKLVDAIGEKRSGAALMLLKDLLYGGQDVPPVLAMVARQFRLILQCKGYYEKGYSADAIANKLSQPGFVVKKCISQSRNFTMEQLKAGLSLCLELDYGMKSGQIRDVTGLEMLIIKMCSI